MLRSEETKHNSKAQAAIDVLDKKAQRLMLEDDLSYVDAFMRVIRDPRNKDLVVACLNDRIVEV